MPAAEFIHFADPAQARYVTRRWCGDCLVAGGHATDTALAEARSLQACVESARTLAILLHERATRDHVFAAAVRQTADHLGRRTWTLSRLLGRS